jgi:hypothetical protein
MIAFAMLIAGNNVFQNRHTLGGEPQGLIPKGLLESIDMPIGQFHHY